MFVTAELGLIKLGFTKEVIKPWSKLSSEKKLSYVPHNHCLKSDIIL